MVGEIILIAGLPGSGKTTHMDSMRRDGWTIFDDFKANAYNARPPSSTRGITKRCFGGLRAQDVRLALRSSFLGWSACSADPSHAALPDHNRQPALTPSSWNLLQ